MTPPHRTSTSETNPIRVDWIPTALWPGRLGLTFAPGKKGQSVYHPGEQHDRDLGLDMQALAQAGTHVIAPLIEDFEYDLLGMEGYEAAAEQHLLSVAPYAIPDRHVPLNPHDFADYLDELMMHLLSGRSVVVHCRGGLGRAGLTAACLLTQGGMAPQDAIALVRQTRSDKAIETAQQEQFIRDFAR